MYIIIGIRIVFFKKKLKTTNGLAKKKDCGRGEEKYIFQKNVYFRLILQPPIVHTFLLHYFFDFRAFWDAGADSFQSRADTIFFSNKKSE